MAVTVTSLDELSDTEIQTNTARAAAFLAERFPDIRIEFGVLYELVAFLGGGLIGSVATTEAERVVQSQSLLAIQKNPELADPDIVDAVLSNWNLTRTPGGNATGHVIMVVSSDAAVALPVDYELSANGVSFLSQTPITALPVGSEPSGAFDQAMLVAGPGQFTFRVPVVAQSSGVAGNVRQRTVLLPTRPPANFLTAYADGDFSGGVNVESNQELLARQQAGVAFPTLSGRVNTFAIIRKQPEFAAVRHMSLIGFGNAEMHRDRHWIWPGSGGGKADLYVRTSAVPVDTVLRKTATLWKLDELGGTYRISLLADDAPGCYEAVAVYTTTLPAAKAIVQQTRGYASSAATGFMPELASAAEAAFSPYQTLVVDFLDPSKNELNSAIGQQAEFDITVRGFGLLGAMQTFVNGPDNRYETGDLLVRAAVPCFLDIAFKIQSGVGESQPDVAAIRAAVADAINEKDFPGRLHGSVVADVVQQFLSPRQALAELYMHGRIIPPSGDDIHLQAADVLIIPYEPNIGVTDRTVATICYPDDVLITIETGGFKGPL